MFKWITDTEWKRPYRKFFDNIYLFFFMLYITREFLTYTMFPIDWKAPFGGITLFNNIFSWIFDSPQYLLICLVIIRLILLEYYEWKYILASVISLICVRCAWLSNHSVNILLFALLIIGAKDIPFRRIVKTHLFTLVTLLAVTVFSSQIGLIDSVYYIRSDGWGRNAFGMTYPTNFAAYIFFAVLYYWYYKGEKLRYLDIGLTGALGIFVLVFSRARCSFICMMLTVIFMLLYKKKWNNPVLGYFLSMVTTFSAIIFSTATLLYSQENMLWKKINRFLSNRLYLGKKGIDVYGFSLWGQAISMNGNGEGERASKYFFLDSSYMQFGIIYGLVIFGLILLAFYAIGCKARRNGDWAMLWILALIGIHSMVEQHMLEVSSCTFILALFASQETTSEQGEKRWKKRLLEQGRE